MYINLKFKVKKGEGKTSIGTTCFGGGGGGGGGGGVFVAQRLCS